MSGGAKRPWPTELRLSSDKARLTVQFDSGEQFVLPAEYLRVESPSAEVQGHGSHQKQFVTGQEGVKITALEPVSNYAVRIRFDDGQDLSLFSIEVRHQPAREQVAKMAV